MERFTVLTAVAAPLLQANVNTDLIIPARHSTQTRREDLGDFAFEALRFHADGAENPEFVLNREPFRQARILLGGANFGCGSSRETAVWAVAGLGIRCVIAPSFGEIFHGNCFQNGVLAVQLPAQTVTRLAQAILDDPARAILTVDLERQVVMAADGEEIAFSYDPYRKQALLEGLDDIGMTQKLEARIASFEEADRQRRPWIYLDRRLR